MKYIDKLSHKLLLAGSTSMVKPEQNANDIIKLSVHRPYN